MLFLSKFQIFYSLNRNHCLRFWLLIKYFLSLCPKIRLANAFIEPLLLSVISENTKPQISEHPKLHSKYLFLGPQISVVVLTSCQGNFFLQEMEKMTENHNQSKLRVVQPGASGAVYRTALAPKAQGTLQRRGG